VISRTASYRQNGNNTPIAASVLRDRKAPTQPSGWVGAFISFSSRVSEPEMSENEVFFQDTAVEIGHLAAEILAVVRDIQEIERDVTAGALIKQRIFQNQAEALELIRSAEENILILGKFIKDQARAGTALRN
jgi:hypothetical protein